MLRSILLFVDYNNLLRSKKDSNVAPSNSIQQTNFSSIHQSSSQLIVWLFSNLALFSPRFTTCTTEAHQSHGTGLACDRPVLYLWGDWIWHQRDCVREDLLPAVCAAPAVVQPQNPAVSACLEYLDLLPVYILGSIHGDLNSLLGNIHWGRNSGRSED